MIILRRPPRSTLFPTRRSSDLFERLRQLEGDRGLRRQYDFFIAGKSGAPSPGTKEIVLPAESRSEEHTSELQSHVNLVCRLLLQKKNTDSTWNTTMTAEPSGKI